MEVENAQIIIKGRAICKYRRRYPNRVRGWNRKALSITDRCSQRTEYRKIQQRTRPGKPLVIENRNCLNKNKHKAAAKPSGKGFPEVKHNNP